MYEVVPCQGYGGSLRTTSVNAALHNIEPITAGVLSYPKEFLDLDSMMKNATVIT